MRVSWLWNRWLQRHEKHLDPCPRCGYGLRKLDPDRKVCFACGLNVSGLGATHG